jgi:hypothetical protein
MKTAILCAFLCTASLCLSADSAVAASAAPLARSPDTAPAFHGGEQNIMTIAEGQKWAAKKKKKEQRCKFLIENCQYVTSPQKAAKICTTENVKFMNEKCLK